MTPAAALGVLSPSDAWSAWSIDPLAVVALAVAAGAYARGVRSLWRDDRVGRGISPRAVAAFVAGLAAVAVALVSPLHAMGEATLTAHMAQHVLLMIVAAPLLVVGRPVLAFEAALSKGWRRRLRSTGQVAAIRIAGHVGSHPIVVWWVALVSLWAWHAPAAYDLALRRPIVHAAEHAAFLGVALLFWWRALAPDGRRRLARGADVLFVVTGSFPGAVLGALLALAQSSIYPAYATTTAAWGLTPLQDQRIAGVLMWLSTFAVSMGAAAVLFVRWLRAAERDVRRTEERPVAPRIELRSGVRP